MAMADADPFASMKAMGHTDIETTMIYVWLGKSHIWEQVEKLNSIQLLPLPTPRMKTLPARGDGAGRITCSRTNSAHRAARLAEEEGIKANCPAPRGPSGPGPRQRRASG